MRLGTTALLALLITAPFAMAAPTASFQNAATCGAPGVFPVVRLADCGIAHEGVVSFVACGAGSCTVNVAVAAAASLPANADLRVFVEGDDGPVVVCSVAASALVGDVACEGDADVTLVAPSGCRLFLVRSVATVGLAIVADAVNEVSVCADGNVTAY